MEDVHSFTNEHIPSFLTLAGAIQYCDTIPRRNAEALSAPLPCPIEVVSEDHLEIHYELMMRDKQYPFQFHGVQFVAVLRPGATQPDIYCIPGDG